MPVPSSSDGGREEKSLPPRGLRSVGGVLLLACATVAPYDAPCASDDRARLLEQLRTRLRDAELAMRESRYELAGDMYRRAMDEARRLVVPNLPLARATDGLADVHRLSGRLEEATRLYGESARMWETLLGERQPRLATTLHNLGAVYVTLGRVEDASPHLQRALTIWENTLGPDSPQAQNTRRLLSRAR